MMNFPPNIKFKYHWRTYQAKVLSDLEPHLDDNHLHVVAAPGSGKTVLGLEVILRINKPTLILSPTIAIRNQWISRFLHLFLQTYQRPDWISDDIRNPKLLTVSTYQGLHSAFKESPDFIEKLKAMGLNVLVVDEAHHLRNEWWKSLFALKKSLKKPQIVALTATPPYDVSPFEWKRYQDLCGPIDAEISVPELVYEGNLCPHQDYVYLNSLSDEEAKRVKIFRKSVKHFVRNLKRDDEFINALQINRFVIEPEKYFDKILADPIYFSAIIIFLNSVKHTLPKKLIKILGVSKRKIPKFNLAWAEILLTHFLYSIWENENDHEELTKRIKHELKLIGAVEKRKVLLRNNSQIKKILKNSINKLNSINEIVKHEYDYLGHNLRMVILTDFIRKEFLSKKRDSKKPLTRIGVVPIFENIRRSKIAYGKIGILSGSLIIIPRTAKNLLMSAAHNLHIPTGHIQMEQLSFDANYLEVKITGANNQKKVQLITDIFSAGGIEILIGTKSLLGEGWDAPCINSLILASFVGSFMLSNQMRGRAIRSMRDDPDKTANIWHLVSVEKGLKNPGHDFVTMKRRFKSFVGLSFCEETIESGFERMCMGSAPYNEIEIWKLNRRTMKNAVERDLLASKWVKVLNGGEVKEVIPELKTTKKSLPRGFVFFNTIMALIWEGLVVGAFIFARIVEMAQKNDDLKFLMQIVLVALGISVFVISLYFLKALYLFLRHGPVSSSLKQIGKALLRTLCKIEAINTDVNKMKVVTRKNEMGAVYCSLEGGTSYEKSVFLDALEEILSPINNPRYVLVRKNNWSKFFRKDYHTVPEVIGARKKWAEYFSIMWKKYVGANELIYTRNTYGRWLLLQAREHSMSRKFQKKSERRSAWK